MLDTTTTAALAASPRPVDTHALAEEAARLADHPDSDVRALAFGTNEACCDIANLITERDALRAQIDQLTQERDLGEVLADSLRHERDEAEKQRDAALAQVAARQLIIDNAFTRAERSAPERESFDAHRHVQVLSAQRILADAAEAREYAERKAAASDYVMHEDDQWCGVGAGSVH